MNERENLQRGIQNPVGMVVAAARANRPGRVELSGRLVSLLPVDAAAHGDALWDGTCTHDELWMHMAHGPFAERSAFEAHLTWMAVSEDPFFYAIVDNASGLAVGYASYLRIELIHRVIEVGNIVFTPKLKKTAGATEAMYLLARNAFEQLGFRRYEWKCDAKNLPSRCAALRLGFQFEGIFRQHMMIKGLNRDTSWFSIVDHEWPARKKALELWLKSENFDGQGRQRVSLSTLTASFRSDENGAVS